jgi:hypothetical protein
MSCLEHQLFNKSKVFLLEALIGRLGDLDLAHQRAPNYIISTAT